MTGGRLATSHAALKRLFGLRGWRRERTEMEIVCRFFFESNDIDRLRLVADGGIGKLTVRKDDASLQLVTLKASSESASGLDDAVERFAAQCQDAVSSLEPEVLAVFPAADFRQFRITIMPGGNMNAGVFVSPTLISLAEKFDIELYLGAL